MTWKKKKGACSIRYSGHFYHHSLPPCYSSFSSLVCTNGSDNTSSTGINFLYFSTPENFSKDNCRGEKETDFLLENLGASLYSYHCLLLWSSRSLFGLSPYWQNNNNDSYLPISFSRIKLHNFFFWKLGIPTKSMVLIQRVIHPKHILPNVHQVPAKCLTTLWPVKTTGLYVLLRGPHLALREAMKK